MELEVPVIITTAAAMVNERLAAHGFDLFLIPMQHQQGGRIIFKMYGTTHAECTCNIQLLDDILNKIAGMLALALGIQINLDAEAVIILPYNPN